MYYNLEKYQYQAGKYVYIETISINASDAIMIKEYMLNLKAECPTFYEWKLINTETGDSWRRKVAISNLIEQLNYRKNEKESNTQNAVTLLAPNYEKVIKLLKLEHARTVRKFGLQDRTPGEWMNILMEEVGEANQCVVEKAILKTNKYTWEDYKAELIQVAAVVVNAVDCLLRNELNHK